MVGAIIQARCGSSRFPSKVFAELASKPLIWHVVDRLKYCQNIDKIIIATTTASGDDKLVDWGKANNIEIYRGSENNVLNRYYEVALKAGLKKGDYIVRITADDPFKEPSIIDKVISVVLNGQADFAYNNNPPSFPEGLDCEVFTFESLEKSEKESADAYEREHVTQYMYRHPDLFKGHNISQDENLSYLRFTIDTPDDYKMVAEVYDHLYKEGELFVLDDILELFKLYPQIPQINREVSRSAMYQKK